MSSKLTPQTTPRSAQPRRTRLDRSAKPFSFGLNLQSCEKEILRPSCKIFSQAELNRGLKSPMTRMSKRSNYDSSQMRSESSHRRFASTNVINRSEHIKFQELNPGNLVIDSAL